MSLVTDDKGAPRGARVCRHSTRPMRTRTLLIHVGHLLIETARRAAVALNDGPMTDDGLRATAARCPPPAYLRSCDRHGDWEILGVVWCNISLGLA